MARLPALVPMLLSLLAALPPAWAEERRDSLAPVIARITPSVVLVETWRKPAPSLFESDPAFERFFGTDRKEPVERAESATAFVVDAEAGLLVTSDYVVRDVDRFEVKLASGETRSATVVGFDEATGIGLLRITPGSLTAVTWSETEPAIGDPVILVAYVFRKGPLATTGIVAGRDYATDYAAIPSLFLDVAINKGAAGGLVTTDDGQVIGMAYGTYGTSGDPYASLGVAVPGADIRPVIAALAKDGTVRRARLGVTVVSANFRRGALITAVDAGGPAARAGLRADEEIIALNGETLTDANSLTRFIARAPAGTMLTLRIRNPDGDERDVNLATEERID